ncbi:crotonase/enoyl-CoA hydratase family protein [Thalassotalea profundi]|uniref:Enoyl-CoA hydratase n=1 Tax=Thalassotalea profundi TaxID=2036687 RepID=A0ABQ3IZ54_9GAMM|nr:crotonase/enoyl-CoA hydratase family protein [Thalassotalea profundi]GHE95795.1 enoyl-CoA hydratase [Thalassotalea profundi]
MDNRVKLLIENNIAYVKLARPEKLNAIDMAMFVAINKTIKQLKKNRDIRAVVLTAEGENFCSGLDVKSVFSSPLHAMRLLFKFFPWQANLAQRVSTGWRELPVPVIAVIKGKCWGGGLQIAMGADFAIAQPNAEFSIMEGRWGLIPDMGGTLAFREKLNLATVKELAMTAKIISGMEAYTLGLVSHVDEKPEQVAQSLITSLISQSPDSIAGCKKLYNKSWFSSPGMALFRESYYQIRILFGKNQKIKTYNQLNPEKTKPFKKRKFK